MRRCEADAMMFEYYIYVILLYSSVVLVMPESI